jgi:hypothetical protein
MIVWAQHIASMRVSRNVYKVFGKKNLNRRDLLEDLGKY